MTRRTDARARQDHMIKSDHGESLADISSQNHKVESKHLVKCILSQLSTSSEFLHFSMMHVKNRLSDRPSVTVPTYSHWAKIK